MNLRPLILLCSLLGVTAFPGGAAEFFVSPTGSPNGNGTMANPWDLASTLKTPPASIRPGDTVNLLQGTYVAPDRRYLQSYIAGAPNQFVTVRPRPGDRVTIVGGIHVRGAWSIFRDLEVMNTYTNRRSSQAGSAPTDVNTVHCFVVYAPNVKLINNIMHDNGLGMASWSGAPNSELYGNLVYYNGWQAPDRPHGHGLYSQNVTGFKNVLDNIIFDQFGQGIQIYGTSLVYLNNYRIEGNILFNNGSLSTSTEYTRNLLIGGGNAAQNPIVNNNYSYFPPRPAASAGDFNIGYWPYGAGCTSLELNNNYIVSGGRNLIVYRCSVASMTGNTVYGSTMEFNPALYASNTFVSPTDRPRGIRTFVRPNKYETGRANIAIYNWDLASTVTVDISAAGLRPGDGYELRNVQDYFTDIVTGIYTGQPITIPMTGRSVAKPLGWNSPKSTFPEFGTFVLRRTGSNSGAVDVVPPEASIRLPAPGAVVSGTVNLEATATDNVGVAAVWFEIAGKQIGGEIRVSPYVRSVNTATLPDGTQSIVAVAQDAAGNRGTSAPVAIVVKNGTNVDPAPVPPAIPPSGGTGSNASVFVEGEQGRRRNVLVGHDPRALGRRYVYARDSGIPTAEYSVRIPETGNYFLWCRVLAPDAAQDSFTISVDGRPELLYETNGTWSPNWQWKRLEAGTTPRVLALSEGVHRIVVGFPEVGAFLDGFTITTDAGFAPAGDQAVPAPPPDPDSTAGDPVNNNAPPIRSGGSPSGVLSAATTQAILSLQTNKPSTCRHGSSPGVAYSAMSNFFSQTGGTHHSTSVVGLQPASTFRYYVKCQDTAGQANFDDYTIEFSTGANSKAGTGPVTILYIEGESGSRRDKMLVGHDPDAFGLRYVYSTRPNLGKVTFRVNIPVEGAYTIWGRILSPGQNRDSLAVSIDNGPTVEYDTANGQWKDEWRWTQVPSQFTLSKGWHVIHFIGREVNTLLDGFVLTNDSELAPSDTTPIGLTN